MSAKKEGQPPSKRMKFVSYKIGTHDGLCECDEVLACFLLKQLDDYKTAEIIRTSDDNILESCDIVVDIGGIYDLDKLRFDTHQSDFDISMNTLYPNKPWTTKLTSAGLIYAHYGEEVICNILKKEKEDPMIPILFDKMYEDFVEKVAVLNKNCH